jgi:hypothetical protein
MPIDYRVRSTKRVRVFREMAEALAWLDAAAGADDRER